jgi:hypothetical protein
MSTHGMPCLRMDATNAVRDHGSAGSHLEIGESEEWKRRGGRELEDGENVRKRVKERCIDLEGLFVLLLRVCSLWSSEMREKEREM